MDVEKLLKLLDLINIIKGNSQTTPHPFVVGDVLFVRTLTHHFTGRVIRVHGNYLLLHEGAWIADDGRFQQAIDEGTLEEIEPVKEPFWVNMESCVDVHYWRHALPREQK